VKTIVPEAFRINGSSYYIYDDYKTNDDNVLYDIPDFVYDRINAGVGYNFFQNTCVGRMSGPVSGNYNTYRTSYIYYQHLEKFSPDAVAEYIPDEELLENIEKIEVYHSNDVTTPISTYTDPDQMLELIKSGVTVKDQMTWNSLTISDENYAMLIYVPVEHTDYSYRLYIIPFLDGKVPAFVK